MPPIPSTQPLPATAQARLVDPATEEPDIEDVIRRIYATSTERRSAGEP
ncbi:MAG: hypothetical protein ACRD0K_15990 [Egibacteraceae bacterium]